MIWLMLPLLVFRLMYAVFMLFVLRRKSLEEAVLIGFIGSTILASRGKKWAPGPYLNFPAPLHLRDEGVQVRSLQHSWYGQLSGHV